jgi:hypothetical protein
VFFYCIDDGGSWRHGAAGSWWRAHGVRHAQEGGAIWHCGGVDVRSDKFGAWIPILKMSLRKMEAATS